MSTNVKSNLPERELEICQRLRAYRLEKKWGMPDFAETLGIPRDRLASYEYGRAPVRYWLAARFSDGCNVSLRWLATGRGPRDVVVDLADELKRQLPLDGLFSEVYDEYLRDALDKRYEDCALACGLDEERLGSVDLLLRNLPPLGTPDDRAMPQMLLHSVSSHFHRLPPALRLKFCEEIGAAAAAFGRKHEREILDYLDTLRTKFTREGISFRQETLDKERQVSDKQLMATEANFISKLVRRLEPLLKVRGAQSRLAEELGITRQAVNNWLIGNAAPSGETALRLLQWVTAEEDDRKQRKSSQGASTPGEPKTQPKGSSDETKPQSGRKKK